MRKNLLTISLLLVTILVSTFAKSQVDHFTYAITDVQKEGASWSYLRKFNLQTGEYSQILLSGNDVKQVSFDAASKKQLAEFTLVKPYNFSTQPAFSSGVAAIAFDKKNNRLYYTPMFIDQLRYIDLKTMRVYYVTGQGLTGMPEKASDQSNIVTRMVIASDGFGYAMTNDANHLIRFSIGKKSTIEDLGALSDASSNKGISVHNSCSSYGGDMFADNDDNIYIVSAQNNVFKVSTETKVATHLGVVKGLPTGYTINGVAVDDNNKLLVTSAVNGTSYFTVDPKTLTATPYVTSSEIWRASDLANSNVLDVNMNSKTISVIASSPVSFDKRIQLYPNPAVNEQFSIQFSQLEKGNYVVQVTDVTGKQVLLKRVTVGGEEQTEKIQLDAASAKGLYLVKVTDKSNNAVFERKVFVQ
ncbi:MAG: T9SS type A sorting domain-containing protein [Chitinophagaceae bacterium]